MASKSTIDKKKVPKFCNKCGKLLTVTVREVVANRFDIYTGKPTGQTSVIRKCPDYVWYGYGGNGHYQQYTIEGG